MFETAELGRRVEKEQYREQLAELRTVLLRLQQQLHDAPFPVIILVNGVEAAGKGEVVNLLNEWLDARNVSTVAFDTPTEEELHRPLYWRYWMALPPRGRIGVFTSNWYTQPIVERAFERIDDAGLLSQLQRIVAFERTLVEDGALFIKLWLHVSKRHQDKRLRKLEREPSTRWRVDKRDWKHARRYDVFRRISERVLRETSTGLAPWHVVEATDARYRNLRVGQLIAQMVERRLATPVAAAESRALEEIEDPFTILDTLDLTQTLDQETYRAAIPRLQGKLNRLSLRAAQAGVGTIVVFEGSDAAGKGGAIRRITGALDARHCRVIQVAAPTDEERAHHYLWRFWRHLPRLGRFTIYDRSWYGRVLVERVEGFAAPDAWMRAYKEIRELEEQLVDFGIVLCKFWLHISPEEQLRRFEERERVPWKQYKITAEDYRNRDKTNLYEAAANEMIERTSTEYAPWTLIPAEDKRFARVEVLRNVCERLERAIEARQERR